MQNRLAHVLLVFIILALVLSEIPSGKGVKAFGTEIPGTVVSAITVEREVYYTGEVVNFLIEVENKSTEPVEIQFNSSQQYDLEITGPNSYYWRWSQGKFFLPVLTSYTLKPGEKKSYHEAWNAPEEALPGIYRIKAYLTSSNRNLEASTELRIEIGSGWREVFFQDDFGEVIMLSTFRQEILDLFTETGTSQEYWIGGKVEQTDNPPWHFDFRPDSLSAKTETPTGARAKRITEIENNLNYWTSVPTTFIHLKPLSSSKKGPFSDTQGHWANAPALALFQEGVVNGYPDGTFRPDGLLTRAEFAKMVILALKISPSYPSAPTFSDVSKDHWGFSYIEAAAKAGLFKGFPDGSFRPEEPVTKEQILTVIVRNAGWKLVQPSNPTFPDLSPENWASSYVETALQEGFIEKGDYRLCGEFWGAGIPATRGQTALLLARLLFLFNEGVNQVIIKADQGGGLVPVESLPQHVISFQLYGDGTFIVLRDGFVRTGKITLAQALDMIIFLASYGFFQMNELYRPETQVYDAPSTYIQVNLNKIQKEVSEYAWGAPGEFHFLFTYLKRCNLGKTEEYIPSKSTLFVNLIGAQDSLNEDQKRNIVELPEEFKKGLPKLSELAKLQEGFELKPEFYALIAPLLGAHERVIIA
ncbi:MAG: S-layer homology domain-containing protein, partial [bacterium]